MEAKHGHVRVATAADRLTLVFAANCVAGVFNNADIERCAKCMNCFHVTACTGKMNGYKHFREWFSLFLCGGNFFSECLHAEVAGGGVYIDKVDRGATVACGICRCHKSIGYGPYKVARANVER